MSESRSIATTAPAPSAPAVGRSAAADELAEFLRALLEFQCGLVGGIAGIIYLNESGQRPGGVAARFEPGDGRRVLEPAVLRQLERIGAEAGRVVPHGTLEEPAGIVEPVTIARPGDVYAPGPTHRAIACPLIAESRAEGASVVLVPAAGDGRPGADAVRRLALSCARFEAFLWRQHCIAEGQQRAMLRETLVLLDAAQQGADAPSMASLFCHEIQRRFACSRVSLGLIERGRLRVAAISGSDEIDRRGALAQALEAAMEECADQDCEIVYPPPPELESDPAQRRVTRAHESLVERFGPAAAMSLPLRVEGDLVGVALLERDPRDPFPPGAASLMRLVAEFVGPAVWTRRLADRGVLAVARDRAVEIGHLMVGPRYTGAKILALIAAVTLAAASLVPVPAWVRGEAEVRAAVARAISPPFIGYIESVRVRPGDAVAPGDVLARLDTSELEYQLVELENRRRALVGEEDAAMATGDAAKAAVLAAQVREVDSSIALVRDRIAHAEIVAPIAGTVSRGDLETFVGARVEPTQQMFEIVGPSTTVLVRVDERDAGDVRPGAMAGTLVLRSLPDTEIPVRVTRLSPMSEAAVGGNVYTAEAEIDGDHPWIRPGMTGSVRLRRLDDEGRPASTTWLRRVADPLLDAARIRFWW